MEPVSSGCWSLKPLVSSKNVGLSIISIMSPLVSSLLSSLFTSLNSSLSLCQFLSFPLWVFLPFPPSYFPTIPFTTPSYPQSSLLALC